MVYVYRATAHRPHQGPAPAPAAVRTDIAAARELRRLHLAEHQAQQRLDEAREQSARRIRRAEQMEEHAAQVAADRLARAEERVREILCEVDALCEQILANAERDAAERIRLTRLNAGRILSPGAAGGK